MKSLIMVIFVTGLYLEKCDYSCKVLDNWCLSVSVSFSFKRHVYFCQPYYAGPTILGCRKRIKNMPA